MLFLHRLAGPLYATAGLGTLAAGLLLSESAPAAEVWRGDFETGTAKQFSYLLNPSGIEVVSAPVFEGSWAALISITDQAEHIWPNGLNRVEFKYGPGASYSSERTEFFFTWAFYLPVELTTDEHQIGYIESEQSYQQMMSFIARGPKLSFYTRKPMREQWVKDDALTTNTWHRIGLHVLWSKDIAAGHVDVWFDGEQVVSEAVAQTLADDNAHFIQLGILRDTIATAEQIAIDDAKHFTTLDELLLAQTASGGTELEAPQEGTTTATEPPLTGTDSTSESPDDLASGRPQPTSPGAKKGCSLGLAPGTESQGALKALVWGAAALVMSRIRSRRKAQALR